ncbi:MAG: LytR/AlgR family response regulator transcription factor [bacterium]
MTISQKKIRAVIVDDEDLAREMIKEYLSDHSEVEIVAECSNGAQAVKTINDLKPDLIFLDIQMPELSGFDVLNRLDTIPMVIFSTAYDKYAIQAFEVNAVDYLLKPYDRMRFNQAVHRALKGLGTHEGVSEQILGLLNHLREERQSVDRFWIRESGCLTPIKTGTIDWIEAMDDYVCLHVGKSKHLVNQTMRELEVKLDENKFMRIHRSTIVNLDRIKELRAVGDGSYQVILKDGTELSLSRGRAKKLREMII